MKHIKLGKYNRKMGHVAKCYKIFFHKDLSIFKFFYDNLILEIWTSKYYFQQTKDFLHKLHTWYTSQKLIIKYFKISHLVSIFQYYITIVSFTHKRHYIKVYWVHLIYPWPDMCFCTTFKIHNKLNAKDLTMKF